MTVSNVDGAISAAESCSPLRPYWKWPMKLIGWPASVTVSIACVSAAQHVVLPRSAQAYFSHLRLPLRSRSANPALRSPNFTTRSAQVTLSSHSINTKFPTGIKLFLSHIFYFNNSLRIEKKNNIISKMSDATVAGRPLNVLVIQDVVKISL